MKKLIFLFFLAMLSVAVLVSCESEYNPASSGGVVHDSTTIVVYDSTTIVVHDTTVIYDSTTIYDSTCCDTCITEGMVYQGCVTLENNIKVGTLGRPGYLVTVSRAKTNGHGIEFCLYVYGNENGGYTGILVATHTKQDQPAVRVEVLVNNNPPFIWDVDQEREERNLTF